MIAPEKWYEYQKQYQKYGIDMKPESESIPRRERIRKESRQPGSRGTMLSPGSDHKVMVSMILICTVALLMVVVMASYAAKLTYDINTVKAENDVICGEIEDLDVKMLSSSTITYVESQAKDELGMKSADSKHQVYLAECDTPEEGFADILKEKAYN